MRFLMKAEKWNLMSLTMGAKSLSFSPSRKILAPSMYSVNVVSWKNHKLIIIILAKEFR